ncbi:MAG: GIY-YIG nuclease family protein [Patescibacteria group bacterium]|nr:GIY-YIG nuclease family protein [Patescibacteria group bacterium]MDD5491006.1 GIY-YIG nuclease family protein [Patescibacteria group bacterium]
MEHFVYILQSLKDSRYYIGSTNDLSRRLEEHNSGKRKSLKFRRPLETVYSEIFSTKQEAHKRELQIKSYKGGNEFKKLIIKR